jgi:hypothetical protein
VTHSAAKQIWVLSACCSDGQLDALKGTTILPFKLSPDQEIK